MHGEHELKLSFSTNNINNYIQSITDLVREQTISRQISRERGRDFASTWYGPEQHSK